jgi:hypothetical protein
VNIAVASSNLSALFAIKRPRRRRHAAQHVEHSQPLGLITTQGSAASS